MERMSIMAITDDLMEDILETSFGDDADLQDEHFVTNMITCLMKKLNYKSTSFTDLEKENVANLLVLFQDEAVSRVQHLSSQDLQEILKTIPPKTTKIHHETAQEEEEIDKKIQHFDQRNVRIRRTFKALTSPPKTDATGVTPLSLKELEAKTVDYVASRAKDLGVVWKYDHSLVSNQDFLRVTKLMAEHIHAFETAYTGAQAVKETEHGFNAEEDDVTAVLATLANNRRAALSASGRAFQEELLMIKEQCRSDDVRDNHALAQEVMKKEIKMGITDEGFIESMGWESATAREERVFIEAEVARVREMQEAILQSHRKELDDILGTLSQHNERAFLAKLRRLKREKDQSSQDLEELVSDSFSLLQTKSRDLQTKYDSLFQKAKLSVIEQFESSRAKLYSEDDKRLPALSRAVDLPVSGPSSAASSPEKSAADENKDVLLVPWKVAVERELSQFNQAITTQFEEDSSALFSQALREISVENVSKLDQYLNTT